MNSLLRALTILKDIEQPATESVKDFYRRCVAKVVVECDYATIIRVAVLSPNELAHLLQPKPAVSVIAPIVQTTDISENGFSYLSAYWLQPLVDEEPVLIGTFLTSGRDGMVDPTMKGHLIETFEDTKHLFGTCLSYLSLAEQHSLLRHPDFQHIVIDAKLTTHNTLNKCTNNDLETRRCCVVIGGEENHLFNYEVDHSATDNQTLYTYEDDVPCLRPFTRIAH